MSEAPETGTEYDATTHGIRVAVRPLYLDFKSDPDKGRYFWAYQVHIVNEGDETVQLRDRTWLITDANGNRERVHGAGVVGEQPVLGPGDEFSYTSGCPLTTPSGFMVGSYTMVTDGGAELSVDIPGFALDLPHVGRVLN